MRRPTHHFGYATGLRASELVGARLGDIRRGEHGDHWLHVLGTPIRRHRKIRADANPFDPQWESYFEAPCIGIPLAYPQ